MVGLFYLSLYPRNSLATAGYVSLRHPIRTITDPCIVAVAARFGIGKDFWTNVVLTLCGYIPGKLIFACQIKRTVPETEPRSRPQFLHTGTIETPWKDESF